jgi:hypothetical protein
MGGLTNRPTPKKNKKNLLTNRQEYAIIKTQSKKGNDKNENV